ncbi:hypothetical protein CF15_00125 [Pyrodictium occultum]|uniref:Uncharacterized protein n=1 Tax=Pyrodictium occultum TaxID=2309 RepID=A0A0V8RTC1_PYROC|nr:hypothetical protein CF15_00125 [Pyrodictium occultum]
MAWRNIMASILEAALDHIEASCTSGEADAARCAKALVAAADALYTPLKPIDSGLGEARRIATSFASLVANVFIYNAASNKGEEFIKSVMQELKETIKSDEPLEEAKSILEKVSAAMQPARLDDSREAVFNEVRDYLEPPQPAIPRRRRRQPRRPDPLQNIRRLIRELGRRDPLLAKQVARILKARGLPV